MSDLIVAFVCGGFGLLLLWLSVRDLFRELTLWRLARESQHWEGVPGRITRSKARVMRAGRWSTYETVVAYRYRAGDQGYTGDRLNFDVGLPRYSRQQVEEALQPYPRGATVTVYYDPARPAVATLERHPPRGQAGSCLLKAMVGAASVFFMVIGGMALASLSRSIVGL